LKSLEFSWSQSSENGLKVGGNGWNVYCWQQNWLLWYW